MPAESNAVPPRLTGLQWLIAVIAAIGFAFDSYELLMAPLFVGPALVELLGVPPGDQATARTTSVWPTRVWTVAPVAAFQIRAW